MISRWSACNSRTTSRQVNASDHQTTAARRRVHRDQPHEPCSEDQRGDRPTEPIERHSLADRNGEADPDVPAAQQMQQVPFARPEPGSGAVERGCGHGGDEEIAVPANTRVLILVSFQNSSASIDASESIATRWIRCETAKETPR